MSLSRAAVLALGATSLVALLAPNFIERAAAQTADAAMNALATPENWPARAATVVADPAVERRVDALLAAMSIEQKVGQIIQADIASVTPDDVYRYHLGSVLNGGNSDPGGRYNAPAKDWLAAADAFYAASMKRHGTLPRIPVIWGSDAVHGHNNVVGATLFPHNIGLGAARNPDLIRRIGAATAIEMRVTGLDWTFAPTLAVVRDDRWGRTYEGFGETPEIATSYAAPLIEGLQGRIGDKDWLRGPHIVATAKHFLGDGGTSGGKDQGDAVMSEAQLRDLFSPPYLPALDAGVQSVMISFSSWNGVKMHGHQSLMTGVMKDRWNFGGFLVGDWNGHGQVAGCTATDCPQSVIAGLDMYMAPDSWKDLYGLFLFALFVLASGVVIVQVVANPLISLLGKPQTAHSRLTFAQAFNSLGTTIFPLVGAGLILGSLKDVSAEDLSGTALDAYRVAESQAIVHGYLGIAAALAVVAVAVWMFRGRLKDEKHEASSGFAGLDLLKRPRFSFGALCIFLYVGAEVSIGSLVINYLALDRVLGQPESAIGWMIALYWGGAMLGRFIGSGVMYLGVSPGKLLAAVAVGAITLILVSASSSGTVAAYSLLAIGLTNAIMFPTIFSLASEKLGPRAADGSGIINIAIFGGAVVPLATGALADLTGSLALALLLPALCYAVIACFGYYARRPAA